MAFRPDAFNLFTKFFKLYLSFNLTKLNAAPVLVLPLEVAAPFAIFINLITANLLKKW
jgi:hypothetical protein